MYAGGLMSPMQRCLSDLVTSYVIDAYLCMATLHAWTLEYDALRLMNDTCEGRKAMASWRRPPGLPRNVWLNKVKEDATLYCYYTLWRSEIAMGHGAAQRFTRTKRRR